jgi:hypothetical protein
MGQEIFQFLHKQRREVHIRKFQCCAQFLNITFHFSTQLRDILLTECRRKVKSFEVT